MKKAKPLLTVLFGILMLVGGTVHFIKPEAYYPIIPDFLPKPLFNYLGGIAELILGIGVFIPRFRPFATLGILLLMILFLPLHIIDVFREHPAIGSKTLAIVRIPLQFILIVWAWFIYKRK